MQLLELRYRELQVGLPSPPLTLVKISFGFLASLLAVRNRMVEAALQQQTSSNEVNSPIKSLFYDGHLGHKREHHHGSHDVENCV